MTPPEKPTDEPPETPEVEVEAKPKPATKKPAAKKPAGKKPAAKAAEEPDTVKKKTDNKVDKPASEEVAETAKATKTPARKAKAAPKTASAKGVAKQPDEVPAEQARTAKDETKVEAEKPAPEKPAPAVRAAGTAQAPVPRRKVVRAQARYVRTSARKARMVCGHLRGKSVAEARAILAFTPREVARDWAKLLDSAVANAENNHELIEEDLLVREAFADEGPTIKRFRPRAQGRATPIRKRTSHLTITLTPRA